MIVSNCQSKLEKPRSYDQPLSVFMLVTAYIAYILKNGKS